MIRRCFVLCALLLGASCSHSAPEAKSAPPAATTEVGRYLPLKDNFVFAYETLSEDTGERGVLMLRVKRRSAKLVELGAGSRVQRLELEPDAIRHVTGGYLLKSPLLPGKKWRGQFGEVTVVAIDRQIAVPAGKFAHCLEILEQASPPTQKQVRTVFCPDVGIASLEAEGMSEGNYAHERASLRSYGPAIDLSQDMK